MAKVLAIILLAAGVQSVVAQQQGMSDPLYSQQWHLENTGQSGGTPGEDINVEPVWNTTLTSGVKIRGQGVYISIVDGDLQLGHPDLIDNISTTHTHDYFQRIVDNGSHATNVAGIVAARGYNGIGVRGVAPLAKIYSLNPLGIPAGHPRIGINQPAAILNAMTRHRTITAVSNNSWGPENPFQTVSSLWALAINTGIEEGFYGKGTVYVWAAGNEHCDNSGIFCGIDNANYDNRANYHAVVAVCAVDHQGRHNGSSEFGANLWVCAPSRNRNRDAGIVTTNRPSTYTTIRSGFGGTSAATPMVSGVAALMRQANPNLGWRDVKLILANSARQNDSADSDWAQGAVKYGMFSDGSEQRYHFNHKYGFGIVNSDRAVELAEGWVNIPDRMTQTVKNTTRSQNREINRSISIQSDINYIEYVDATIDFYIFRLSSLSIELISPSGAISKLAEPTNRGFNNSDVARLWRFGSAKHLGENPSGTWRLRLENTRGTQPARLNSWELTIHGHQIKMDAVPAAGLSDTNVAETTLTLSLTGARWKDNLQLSDFSLKNLRPSNPQFKNVPAGLRVSSVRRTSDTQVQLNLALTGNLLEDYSFQVEATTGTVSSLSGSLASNNITIVSNTRIAVRIDSAIPNNNITENYDINLEDIFASSQTLTYMVSGLPPGLEIRNGSIISGASSVPGYYRIKVVATRADGVSRTEFFDFQILPTIQVEVRVLLEGALITFVDVCDRTKKVRDEIISQTQGSDCADVPQNLLRSITNMDLSNSGISALLVDDFDDVTGLQTLNLSSNGLTDLPSGVFNNLTNLRILDLSSNSLTTLTSVTFSGLQSLQTLNLSSNQMTNLPADVFSDLTNLRTLNLSNNGLTMLAAVTFNNLQSLETLNLSSNSLTILPTTIFDNLANLRSLDLSNNMLSQGISNNQQSFNMTFDMLDPNTITTLNLTGNGIDSTACDALRRSLSSGNPLLLILLRSIFSCS